MIHVCYDNDVCHHYHICKSGFAPPLWVNILDNGIMKIIRAFVDGVAPSQSHKKSQRAYFLEI